jgi:hypothetical protein
METPVETVETSFNVLESIRAHIEQLKPLTPRRGLVCIGEYPAKILLKPPLVEKISGISPILLLGSSEEILKMTQPVANSQNVLGVDADVDTHFWFNVESYIAQNEGYAKHLRGLMDKLHEVILLVSLWDGLGSALLPTLISEFKTSNANSVALAVLPSKSQASDAHFNALASIGKCMSNEAAAVVLLGRDFVEDYVGVDRDGSRMKGNSIIGYLLEMMLAKETLPQELSELSRAFNVKLYTVLAITGASFKVYGSFETMLDAAALNPFLTFDLTSASVLYVLVRAPIHLRDKLSRGQIELATAKWSKRIPSVRSIYVSEPVYVDDASDRVDAVVFAGSFDLTELTVFFQKKAGRIKNEKVKKGLVKEEEWEAIIKGLSANQ